LFKIWRSHPYLTSALALASAVTLFFIIRTALFAVYWSDPAHRDQIIQGWMTPGYVAHSWKVPQDLMRDIIGAPPMGNRPTLTDLAAQQGVTLEQLIARIEAAITAHRDAQ